MRTAGRPGRAHGRRRLGDLLQDGSAADALRVHRRRSPPPARVCSHRGISRPPNVPARMSIRRGHERPDDREDRRGQVEVARDVESCPSAGRPHVVRGGNPRLVAAARAANQSQVAGTQPLKGIMKVRPSVKPMCEKCKIIRRHGVVLVICSEPAAQAASGLKMARIAGVNLPLNKRV